VLRTLIVEDNIAFRQSLGGILREALPDAQVSEAGDGDEALRQIAAAEPDFIFMDIRLPGENGLRLTKRIKAAHPDIVIAIITNHDLPEYRQGYAHRRDPGHHRIRVQVKDPRLPLNSRRGSARCQHR
jgi:DNA-binding NarL/FixJ family response regulator